MALTRTTLAGACAVDATFLNVTSATSIAVGSVILIEGEQMVVTKAYVLATTNPVPVLRGQNGTLPVAHPLTAGVVHGSPSDSEWGGVGAQTAAQFMQAGKSRKYIAITTTPTTLTLPDPGTDLLVELVGTSVITLTVPVPTKAMNGTMLWVIQNGVAAHIVTFTGGLSGAGGSYDTVTSNATAPVATQYIACNSLWLPISGPGYAGTATNIIPTVA